MPRRLRARPAAALGASLFSLVLACAETPAEKTPDPRSAVRLAVVVSVDQLRPDRLSEQMPGGLGRMVREGRAWVDAALEHAFTETCPGHAVILTGRHPARIGIPANSYIDPETLEKRYCVEDRAPDAALVGLRGGPPPQPSDGRSPRVMKSSALGDWMKTRRPETRVFTVSGKDRSAITLGGLNPDGAFWLARGAKPSWVTSGYYAKALPAWVAAWDADAALAKLPDDWSYLPEVAREAATGPRPDDYPYESPMLSRTQPHPLRRDPPHLDRLPPQARHVADRLYFTPFADGLTLAFAKSVVLEEKLGSGDGPDLLGIGLSATDLVGHFYGPESWESRDAITRLDRMLGDFFDFLDREIGKDRWVAVLTADHGVLPVPEWIHEQKRSKCPVPGGRFDLDPLAEELEQKLDAAFPTASGRGAKWFALAGGRLTLNRARTGGDTRLETRVLAIASTFFEAHPGIDRVWTKQEVLAGEGPQPMARYFQNSWAPDITGDLAIQSAEDCLASRRIATSHGSPWLYDRAIPLVFLGPGIDTDKVYDQPASSLDVAPTLADYLGIPAPLGLDGKVLALKIRPPGEAGRKLDAE